MGFPAFQSVSVGFVDPISLGWLNLFQFLHFHFVFVVAPHVLGHFVKHHIPCNPQDEEKPKQVQGLQGCQQYEGDVLADPAFVLLSLPVQLKGANIFEVVQSGDKKSNVEIVTHVGPDEHEEGEIRDNQGGVEVIQGFGCL